MNILDNLKYSEDHEWLRIEGDIAYIGITDYAQEQLGDIVFVEINTVGETLSKGDTIGTIEAVKTVSDIYMPVGGEVLECNADLEDNPDMINESPYEAGWIIKVKLTDVSEISDLLDAEGYKAFIA